MKAQTGIIKTFLISTSILFFFYAPAQNFDYIYSSNHVTSEKIDTIRFEGLNWGNRAIRVSIVFDIGFVETKLNSKARALKVLNHSFTLINLTDPKPIEQDTSIMNHLNFNFDYNCFGYCFTDAKYWIDDPMPFLNDEFELTDKDHGEIAIFLSFKQYTDDGRKNIIPIHGIKMDSPDSVSYKPGYQQLKHNIQLLSSAEDYNFNEILFYRRKK